MAKKFNIQTADRQGLVDRVTQLTSALVKQKEVISKLKGSEESLLSENERLQKQIRNLEEEGAVGRDLRGELQNEVARLQRSIELLSAEMQMHRGETASLTPLAVPEMKCAVTKENGITTEIFDKDRADSVSNSQDAASKFQEHLLALNEYLLQISDLSSDLCDEKGTAFVDHMDSKPENSRNVQNMLLPVLSKAAGLLERNISIIEKLSSSSPECQSFYGKFTDIHEAGPNIRGDCGVQNAMDSKENVKGENLMENEITLRLGRELQAAEQGRAQAEERLRATHQAYLQAKKCIEDLERAAADREKEISTLRQVQQRRGDADAAEFQRREQEAARLAAAEAQIASRDAELRAAEERLAQAGREARALQARMAAAAAAAQEREAALEAAARRAEEREAQARREAESARGGLESARRELRQAQEEKALQLEVDKKIIRSLQSEGRARVAELEARIASLEALLRDPHSDAAVGFLGSPCHPPDDPGPAAPLTPGTPASLPITAIGVFGGGAAAAAAGPDADAAGEGLAGERDAGGLGGGRAEELVRRALRAMEEMMEALMRRPDLCRRIDADLAALERELGPAAGRQGAEAVERRVEALCGVVQIAADYLQEIPCPDAHTLAHHRQAPGGGGGSGWWRRWVRAALCACCVRGRAAAGPAYAPVRSSADYDDSEPF